MKTVYKVLIAICLMAIWFLSAFMIGMNFQKDKSKLIVHTNFENTHIQEEIIDPKYEFIPPEIANYIIQMCKELEVDADLAIAILMQENPKIDLDATNRNKNGTMDLGLWQLNDKYLYTTFSELFWQFEDVELNAFDWKHNTFIALHQIQWLQSRLKVFDDIVMAYNCGIGAVMNRTIPESTKVYLCRVKNNFSLLKGIEK